MGKFISYWLILRLKIYLTQPYIQVFILDTALGCTEQTITNEITVSNDANSLKLTVRVRKITIEASNYLLLILSYGDSAVRVMIYDNLIF
jgi:hypothetical protein